MNASPRRDLIAPATVFLGSFLLFLIQPMLAKSILPWLGGSASVWTTCLLFFQTVLLLGYCYAHGLMHWLPAGVRTILHLSLLALSCLLLPPAPQRLGWASVHPIAGILTILLAVIGLPYLILSSTGAMVQSWVSPASSPYPLFALSNSGALLALYAYPLFLEPLLTSRQQQWMWTSGYAIYAILYGLLTIGRRNKDAVEDAQTIGRLGALECGLWFALAMCASTLLLAVTNHLCQDLAAAPLLWIAPLSLYLLSFIVVFHRQESYQARVAQIALPVALIAMVIGIYWQKSLSLWISFLLFGLELFVCCWFCHGELVRSAPHTRHLTAFYLILASGGAAGGLFVSVIAPRIFTGYLELPLALGACGVLMLLRLFRQVSYQMILKYAVLIGGALLIASSIQAYTSNTKVQARNFYGSLSISEMGTGRDAIRLMRHGTIFHGLQFLDPARSGEPGAYYGRDSGAGRWLLRAWPNRRVGIIGLGVGTLAAYARPGDWFTFYEINPLVQEFATSAFSFLRKAPARVDVIVEDGRAALARLPPQAFDMLVVDAFSGDAIPVHLLTREAFEIYYRHLKPDGVLAFHITNQFVDVSRVLGNLAPRFGRHAILFESRPDRDRHTFGASWVLIGRREQLSEVFPAEAANAIRPDGRQPWTDDFSNLVQVLR